jgi:hypothetical protein
MFRGVIKTHVEWAEIFGLSANTVAARIARGTPLDAPQTRGSGRHAGTYDYTSDRARVLPVANRGAKLAKTIQAANPRQPARKAPVTEQQIDALIVAPSVASEETVVRLLDAVGWSLRREFVLGQGVLLAAPGSAP